MIEIKDLTFNYEDEKNPSVENLNITIPNGKCVLLVGESGCGKTTITKLINGLIPHFFKGEYRGSVKVDNALIQDTPLYKLARSVGSVFQNPKSQFFNINSTAELAFALENRGDSKEYIHNRLRKTVEELHIQHLLDRDIFALSGGEKQALAFASIYAMNPSVYVLDEPSANLDRSATEFLKKEIAAIKKEGKTIIIAEHRLYYLTEFIDTVLYIRKGKILKQWTKEQFLTLTEEERTSLSLRTIKDEPLNCTSEMLKEGVLEIRNLTLKVKDRTLFDNLSFALNPGEVVGIFAHNGRGKSTLLRTIAGLYKETNGHILYEGKPVGKKARNRLSYMIMQDVNHQLFADSVFNECVLSGAETEEEISSVLKEYNLYEYKQKHPMALSGGQKERLAIASGILAEKKILLFDEPTAGLDYIHMCTVANTLKYLSRQGHIVLVVTHDIELINLSCDRILKL